MFCQNCGARLEDGANFCPNCGREAKAAGANAPGNQSKPRELDREAVVLHLKNLLVLECCRNRLIANFNGTDAERNRLAKRNYLKRYQISNPKRHVAYAHFFYNGKDFLLAYDGYGSHVYTNGDLYGNKWYVVREKNLRSGRIWEWTYSRSEKRDNRKGLKKAFEEFTAEAPRAFAENQKIIGDFTSRLTEMRAEFDNLNELIRNAYAADIVPMPFRNIYAAYFLTEYMETSNESFSSALLHCDLNEIKAKLDKIIQQQQEIIIRQAISAAQNRELLKQNAQKLERLAGMEQNARQAAQYAEIAAANAESCAFIAQANYIDKITS